MLEGHGIIFLLFLVLAVITDGQVILQSVPVTVGLPVMINSSANPREELGGIIILIHLRYRGGMYFSISLLTQRYTDLFLLLLWDRVVHSVVHCVASIRILGRMEAHAWVRLCPEFSIGSLLDVVDWSGGHCSVPGKWLK